MIITPKNSVRGKAVCSVCGNALVGVATCIGICPECVRTRPEECRDRIEQVHAESREVFGLPAKPGDTPEGKPCNLCVVGCRLEEGRKSYCGVRNGDRKSLRVDGRSRAQVSFYYDPLPTNCVADWVCPGGTGAGFPSFSNESGPEVGYYNLAVFFEACNFNCLYCQNWCFKKTQLSAPKWTSVNQLQSAIKPDTSCVCFFGGDPGPQIPYALRVAKAARESRPDKILRICWETNGSMNPQWLKRMAKTSADSGGCVKVDLKAWNPGTHHALCGWDNRQVLENFKRLAEWTSRRPDPPLLVASTPLVPGYVNEEEIGGLARFIAGLNPDIPYALLAFAPQFLMEDSPTTSAAQAEACLKAAKEAGLKKVRVGNVPLLC